MKKRSPHPLYIQLYDLFLIELCNWRWGWRNLILTGTVLPIFGMILLGSFARELGAEALSYVLVGNLVMALLFEHKGKLISHFSYMKAAGSLDYFATLPVSKFLLILAAFAAFFLLFLPSLLVTLLGPAHSSSSAGSVGRPALRAASGGTRCTARRQLSHAGRGDGHRTSIDNCHAGDRACVYSPRSPS